MPLPTFTYNQIAQHLTDIGQAYFGDTRQSFDVATGGNITVHYASLNIGGQGFAKHALQAWSNVTGINFILVAHANNADILFQHGSRGDGAFADTYVSSGNITSSEITITKEWIEDDWSVANGIRYDSYSFQTYIHEIGHALGLAHAGNYNNSATYPNDAHYSNDSWQASIMSYFSQSENTTINADYAYIVTPMIADIIAIHDLYGTPDDIHLGDTVYGNNSTAGDYMDSLQYVSNPIAFTIYDNGGIDTIDVSSYFVNQTIDLHQEAISSIGGISGNMIIARGVDIENAKGGSGDDHIFGNALNNQIYGYGGNDKLYGGNGNDTIIDGLGNNVIEGQNGNDKLIAFSGFNKIFGGDDSDFLAGGFQSDHIYGNAGNDVIRGEIGEGFLGGSDQITGGTGDDTMMGGRGVDTFIFNTNDGNDIIAAFDTADIVVDATTGYSVAVSGSDFQSGVDHIQLIGFSSVDASNVMSQVTDGATGAIFDAEGTSITLYGVDMVDITQQDFIFG